MYGFNNQFIQKKWSVYSSWGVRWSQGTDISTAANCTAYRACPHQRECCGRGLPQLDPEKRRASAQRPHGYLIPTTLHAFSCMLRNVLVFIMYFLFQLNQMKRHHQVKIFQVLLLCSIMVLSLVLKWYMISNSNLANMLWAVKRNGGEKHGLKYCIFCRPPHGGAAAAPAGGAHLQGVHGQRSQYCIHPLWTPSGVQGVRTIPEKVPHLQRPGQRHSANLPLLRTWATFPV